jgi:formylglycine-generating enzyme required for sulfatase activity
MKAICPILFFLFSLPLFAQEYPNLKPLPNIIDGRELPRVKPIFGDFLYMSETEVTNRQYLDFIDWLAKNKPEEYKTNLPDSLGWRLAKYFNEPFVELYFRLPAYNNYPVVNITQNQAVAYCKWLHNRLTENLEQIKSKVDSFIVRLPTEKEWMMAARGGLPESAVYPWEGIGIRRKEGRKKHRSMLQLNCTHTPVGIGNINWWMNQWAFITTEVYSYWPNGYGLYNMSGNVAEWIAEKGKTKGGSWNLPPYNARIDVAGAYNVDTMSRPDVGFRYVIEIVSMKDDFIPIVFDNKYFSNRNFVYIPIADSFTNNGMYIRDAEITNAEYKTFLQDSNHYQYAIANVNWAVYFPYQYYQMYSSHSGFNRFPVVNISHEAAIAFCKWLTNKYNNLEKRRLKKVVFRLPTEIEWEWAARGGRNNQDYPWGGPYARNSFGSYLANFCPLEEQYLFTNGTNLFYHYPLGDSSISRGIDGSVIPAFESYFPNDYGLYNCSGNVAEMISEFGITKGGSWNSNDYQIMISSRETYTQPSPNIGFRVFMEVIERYPNKKGIKNKKPWKL